MAWSSENEACSSILNFLHWLNYRGRSAHEKNAQQLFTHSSEEEKREKKKRDEFSFIFHIHEITRAVGLYTSLRLVEGVYTNHNEHVLVEPV